MWFLNYRISPKTAHIVSLLTHLHSLPNPLRMDYAPDLMSPNPLFFFSVVGVKFQVTNPMKTSAWSCRPLSALDMFDPPCLNALCSLLWSSFPWFSFYLTGGSSVSYFFVYPTCKILRIPRLCPEPSHSLSLENHYLVYGLNIAYIQFTIKFDPL